MVDEHISEVCIQLKEEDSRCIIRNVIIFQKRGVTLYSERLIVYSEDRRPLTYSCLRGPPEVVVCIFTIFVNKLEIKFSFTEYLKEGCWKCPDKHFSFRYFPNYAFA